MKLNKDSVVFFHKSKTSFLDVVVQLADKTVATQRVT